MHLLSRMMLKDNSYGDQIVIKALSHLWGFRITVVRAVQLTEERFRHNVPLEEADIVLIYNGIDHYSYACKFNVHECCT